MPEIVEAKRGRPRKEKKPQYFLCQGCQASLHEEEAILVGKGKSRRAWCATCLKDPFTHTQSPSKSGPSGPEAPASSIPTQ